MPILPDDDPRSILMRELVQTLSLEEQEFIATYNLFYESHWEKCVLDELVPQAIACYIHQKAIRYMRKLFYTSSDEYRVRLAFLERRKQTISGNKR